MNGQESCEKGARKLELSPRLRRDRGDEVENRRIEPRPRYRDEVGRGCQTKSCFPWSGWVSNLVPTGDEVDRVRSKGRAGTGRHRPPSVRL